jgi:hypothetical protein
MLDWYSNCEPPSRANAIKEVIQEVKKTHSHENLDEICKRIVTDMPSLGSWTGWYVSFQKDAVKAVIDEITTTNIPIVVETPQVNAATKDK